MKIFATVLISLSLLACGRSGEQPESQPAEAPAEPRAEAPSTSETSPTPLERVLDAQPDEVKARYAARHPEQTLEFFEIEPGMTVVEFLPGQGWYTKILLDYLGPDGRLIGADYSLEMWPLFNFMNEERLKAKETWVSDWTAEANGWRDSDDASVDAFVLGSLPEQWQESADAVLMIRALHNLARFEDEGGFLTAAAGDAYGALRPGGILGVVQHQARPDMPDDWADGSRGYLKDQFVIDAMEAAGFEFVAASDINENDLDQPTTDDIVWRLAPSFATSRDNEELKQELAKIGESNRMTLKFRKPE